MSVRSTLSSFFDNAGLSDLFHRKQADVKTLRAPLLKGIERANSQFTKGQVKGPRWWKAQNGVVALTVKVKGKVLDINGVPTNMMPEDRFAEFLGKFSEAVNAGEFDGELKGDGAGSAEVRIGKGRRGSISPEAAKARGLKAAESRARNKAARAAAESAKSAKPTRSKST